jgi:hypothetical protein
MRNEEFYIGYLPRMPERTARAVKIAVAAALFVAAALAVLFWFGQHSFAPSFFEFLDEREFAGTIRARPVPFLLVETARTENGLPVFARYPLVGEGKHGAAVGDFDGRRVKLRGKRIHRDNLEMIEVVSGSLAALEPGVGPPAEMAENLGVFTLRGEIVDSKCYLGVMNPGRTKPHRECAVRCLSGGVPPLFLVHDERGNASELWLTSETGGPAGREILDFVAEPVELEGDVTRLGDQLFLRLKRSSIRRLE